MWRAVAVMGAGVRGSVAPRTGGVAARWLAAAPAATAATTSPTSKTPATTSTTPTTAQTPLKLPKVRGSRSIKAASERLLRMGVLPLERYPDRSVERARVREKWQTALAVLPTRLMGGFSYGRRGPQPQPLKRLREHVFRSEEWEVSPKKLNWLAHLVRGMTVSEALLQLTYSNKARSWEVASALRKALFEAEGRMKLGAENLVVGQAHIASRIIGKMPEIMGRGRTGVRTRRAARIVFHLYEHPRLVPGFTSSKLRLRSGQTAVVRR